MEIEKKKQRGRRKKSDTLNPAASLLAAISKLDEEGVMK